MADGYQDLAIEAALVPNIPAFDQGGPIVQLLQQLLQGQQQLENQIRELQNACVFPILVWCGSRTHSLNSQQLLPMMLYNALRVNSHHSVMLPEFPLITYHQLVVGSQISGELHDRQHLNSRLLRGCLDSLPRPAIPSLSNAGDRLPITVASIKVHTPPVTKGLYTLFFMRSLGERERYAGFGAEKLHLFNIPGRNKTNPLASCS
jgi:hypothetical protein